MSQNNIRPFHFCAVLLFAILAAPGSIPILEWESLPDPSISGYNLYRGTKSRAYDEVVDVGTQTRVDLTGLEAGTTYFFSITAYNADRIESDFSDEVRFTPSADTVTSRTLPCVVIPSESSVTIQFVGQRGQHYQILASQDLLTWEAVYSVQPETNQVIRFQRKKTQFKPMEFFRVMGALP